MAAKTTTKTKTERPARDWSADLVAALADKGVTVTLRPSPKGNYSTVLLDGTTSIGYVWAQTRTGVRVEYLPRGAGNRQQVASAADMKKAVTRLAADAKAALEKTK